MPKPIDIKELPLEQGPCDAAWEKYKAFAGRDDTFKLMFAAGWNAALDWIPFRIAQFREIEEQLLKQEEELRKEIEQLKQPPKP